MNIANSAVQSLAGDGVVSARAHLRSEAIVKDQLAGSLGGDSDAEGHPRQPKGPADDVEVSGRDDQGDDRSVGNGRGTCDVDDQRCDSLRPGARQRELDLRGLFHDRSSEKKEW